MPLVPSPHRYRRNRTITQPCRLRARTTWDGTLATRLVRAPPCAHLHRGWAPPCHGCTGAGPTPATSAPGLGPPLPRLHRGCVQVGVQPTLPLWRLGGDSDGTAGWDQSAGLLADVQFFECALTADQIRALHAPT